MGIIQYFCGDDALPQILQTNIFNETNSENPAAAYNSVVPHVAECLQHSLLILIPCLFLWIFLPVALYTLHKSQNGPLRGRSPITYRIIACAFLQLDLVASLLHALLQTNQNSGDSAWKSLDNPANYLIFRALLFLTIALALVLMLACRNRGVIASGVLFNFWFLLSVCGLPEFRYKIAAYTRFGDETDFNHIQFILAIVYYCLVLLIFLLSCFADTPKYRVTHKKACPESTSSFLSQITFSWFDKMAMLGHKRALVMEDLWDLCSRDESKHLVDKFHKVWNKPITKTNKQQGQSKSSKITLPLNGSPETEVLYPYSSNLGVETSPEPSSILWPLFQIFKWPFLAGAFYKLCFDLLQFASPHLLEHLINFIEDKSQPPWIGVGIAVLMFVVALLQSMILHQYFHGMFRLGMNIRAVLTSVVYKKALLLSNTSRKNRTMGEIVNLMSIDIQRFQEITTFIMLFWSSPLQVFLAIYFLWRLLGFAVIAGLLILILLVPLNAWISIKTRNCQAEQMKYKDERLKMMSEMLNGMKVLKLYAWEESMQKIILEIRRKEKIILRKLACLNSATALSWSCAPFLVAVLTFGVYVNIDSENNILTPQITFVGLALFNILRFPLAVLAMIVNQAVQCTVSNKRLKRFLADEEIDSAPTENVPSPNIAISVDCASFTWDKEGDLTLKNLTLAIPKGALVAVVGRIGSGKSSLLSAILGEMHRKSGTTNLKGKVAYVPQQPWIQNLTLKNNILFGKSLNATFYDKVLDACALTIDLDSLPAGDQTEIGEKGINLSGGQKQRVSLARAVYSESDIYLLDDPLAAVDAHVGKLIFDNVISSTKGMLADKTRVFVTHGLPFLKNCDQIIVIKDGRISESGSYEELLEDSGEFADILEEFLVEETKNRARSVSFGEDAEDMQDVISQLERFDPEKKKRIERQMSKVSEGVVAEQRANLTEETVYRSQSPLKTISSVTTNSGTLNKEFESNHLNSNNSLAGLEKTKNGPSSAAEGSSKNLLTSPKPNKIIEKEEIETGKVKLKIYANYLKAVGYPVFFMFLLIYIFSSLLGVGSNLWLADWSDHAREIQTNRSNAWETHKRLGIYTALGLGQALFVAVASIIMALGMVRAGSLLHEGMLKNLLRSPMSFFDVTPLGRILNRFGKDVDLVDTRVPTTILNFLGMTVMSIAIMIVPIIVTPLVTLPMVIILVIYVYVMDVDGLDSLIPRSALTFVRMAVSSMEIVGLIAIAVPPFTFVMVPLVLIYGCILRFYVSTSRQLKRLESTTRSPIFSHFQESVQGASSIRAYHAVDRFLLESQKRVDYNLIAYFPSIIANRWLAVRLELVGNVIVLSSALFAALYRDSGGITPGLVGLSVSYALSVTQTLNWAVRMTSELEANIVSVERINEYSVTPTEASLDTEPKVNLSDAWPSQGEVILQNLELRYRPDLDLVLKGVSAHIQAREKIGIIGRTGAGKSSLTLALFRLVEPSGGKIIIDGLDISKLGLRDLRSRLTIVPQDPVLFSGTLRSNLDPFNSYEDDTIWKALQLTSMDTFIGSLPERLEHKVNEGGENLSVGQRQLICLARALLRKSKVLMLDEAAASVDMETDQRIQKTIREQFSDCTVLTIAHRLHSVMECDRLLVFDQGKVVEFDKPQVLLARPDSVFRSLAIDAGIPVDEHEQ